VTSFAGATALIGLILRTAGAPPGYALLHPLGAAVQGWIILRAVWRGTRRIEWKGRTYSQS